MTEPVWPILSNPIRRRGITRQAPDLGSEPPEWTGSALCAQVDPEIFYPEKGSSTAEAKRICKSCEVRTDCLQMALDNDERFGVWGGLSERERRRARRGETVVPANQYGRCPGCGQRFLQLDRHTCRVSYRDGAAARGRMAGTTKQASPANVGASTGLLHNPSDPTGQEVPT